MSANVLEAMAEASKHYIDIQQLQEAAGREIARLTNNEAAYLTSGSCAGLLLATAVCLAGDDQAVFGRLPWGAPERKEIIVMKCQHNPFWRSITAAGAALVEIGRADFASEEELARAITENTAGIVYFAEDRLAKPAPPFDAVVQIAKRANVPVVVDAAAQLPPVNNFSLFTQKGADMVIFSGGKMLSGPQCSGLILGSTEMIERCKKYGFPNHGICRGNKIGKEEMIGLYVAVKNFVSMDHCGRFERLMGICRQLGEEMDSTGLMHTEIADTGPVGQTIPLAYGHMMGGVSPYTLQKLMRKMGIYIGTRGDAIFINPSDLTEQEVRIVIEALKQCTLSLKANI